jgi:hypothetical protein
LSGLSNIVKTYSFKLSILVTHPSGRARELLNIAMRLHKTFI